MPPRTEPERLLLDQIAAGGLDPHLTAIAEAVHARRELLHTVSSQKAFAMLSVSDRVRINRNASPQYLQYLHGVHGIISRARRSHCASVCTDRSAASPAARCAARHSYSTDSTQQPDPRRHMSPTRHANPDPEALIDEITVDCLDKYEQPTGFENAFDEDANFPCHGTVVGETVEVLSVAANNDRCEMIATCQRNGNRYEIALLEITIDGDPATSQLLAAYRRRSST